MTLTSKSPRAVLLDDFTLPQLFACLVLMCFEHKDYRGVEALLRDWPGLCDASIC